MDMFNRNQRHTSSKSVAPFDRSTIVRKHGDFTVTIAQMLTNCLITGATGSGKSSGPGAFLARGILAHGFGALILCAKNSEREQWQTWAKETHRSHDVVCVDASGMYGFNFLEWEASRSGGGGGITLNIVSLLLQVSQAISGSSGGGGDNQFWEDSLRLLLTSAVELCVFSGQKVSIQLLRDLISNAPQSLEEAESQKWRESSACWQAMQNAAQRKNEMDSHELADFAETVTYFTREFPALSSRTRSIFVSMFSQISKMLCTRPLRALLCEDTNISPTACFEGKIIIIDVPVMEFELVGKVVALAWLTSFMNAVTRRDAPLPGQNLRPVIAWIDECQVFLTPRSKMTDFAAICRGSAGCVCLLTQSREGLRRVLGSDDSLDALLGNLQLKFFANCSGESCTYAARLIGERWTKISSSGVSYGASGSGGHTETADQKRYFVEPTRFSQLKKGGEVNNFVVETIVYNGGELYKLRDPVTGKVEMVPFTTLSLSQI